MKIKLTLLLILAILITLSYNLTASNPRRLCMFFDYIEEENPTNAKSQITMAQEFGMMLNQKASPGIVHYWIVQQFLTCRANFRGTIDNFFHIINFEPKEWSIYRVSNTPLFLFLPKNYPEEDSITLHLDKAYPFSIPIFKKENLSKFLLSDENISIANQELELKNWAETNAPSDQHFKLSDIKSIFSTEKDWQNLVHKTLPEEKKSPDEDENNVILIKPFLRPWNMFIAGHGSVKSSIAGIDIWLNKNNFTLLLQYLNTLHLQFVLLNSCSLGGENIDYLNLHEIARAEFDFILALAAITDAPTISSVLTSYIEDSNGKKTYSISNKTRPNLKAFFEKLEQLQENYLELLCKKYKLDIPEDLDFATFTKKFLVMLSSPDLNTQREFTEKYLFKRDALESQIRNCNSEALSGKDFDFSPLQDFIYKNYRIQNYTYNMYKNENNQFNKLCEELKNTHSIESDEDLSKIITTSFTAKSINWQALIQTHHTKEGVTKWLKEQIKSLSMDYKKFAGTSSWNIFNAHLNTLLNQCKAQQSFEAQPFVDSLRPKPHLLSDVQLNKIVETYFFNQEPFKSKIAATTQILPEIIKAFSKHLKTLLLRKNILPPHVSSADQDKIFDALKEQVPNNEYKEINTEVTIDGKIVTITIPYNKVADIVKDLLDENTPMKSIDHRTWMQRVLSSVSLVNDWFFSSLGMNGIPQYKMPRAGWYSTQATDDTILSLNDTFMQHKLTEKANIELKELFAVVFETSYILPSIKNQVLNAPKMISHVAQVLPTLEVFPKKVYPIKTFTHTDPDGKPVYVDKPKKPAWLKDFDPFPVIYDTTNNEKDVGIYYPTFVPAAKTDFVIFNKIEVHSAENAGGGKTSGVLHFLRDAFFNLQRRSTKKRFHIKTLIGFNDLLPLLENTNPLHAQLNEKTELTLKEVFIETNKGTNEGEVSIKVFFQLDKTYWKYEYQGKPENDVKLSWLFTSITQADYTTFVSTQKAAILKGVDIIKLLQDEQKAFDEEITRWGKLEPVNPKNRFLAQKQESPLAILNVKLSNLKAAVASLKVKLGAIKDKLIELGKKLSGVAKS